MAQSINDPGSSAVAQGDDQLPDYMQVRDQPIGISILAALHLLGGVGLFVVLSINYKRFDEVQELLSDISLLQILIAAGFLAVLAIASSIGMLKAARWGWWLAAFYYGYSIVRSCNAIATVVLIADELAEPGRGVGYHYVKYGGRIIVATLILAYLFRTNVLQYFRLTGIKKFGALFSIALACVAAWLGFEVLGFLSR